MAAKAGLSWRQHTLAPHEEKRLFVDVIQDFSNSYLKYYEVLTTSSLLYLIRFDIKM